MLDAKGYASLASGQLGGDIAAVHLYGEFDAETQNLPGLELIVGAGMTLASAFLAGFLKGAAKEMGAWGEDVGSSAVRRLRRIVERLTSRRGKTDEGVDDLGEEFDNSVEVAMKLASAVREEDRDRLLRGNDVSSAVEEALEALGIERGRTGILTPRIVGALATQAMQQLGDIG